LPAPQIPGELLNACQHLNQTKKISGAIYFINNPESALICSTMPVLIIDNYDSFTYNLRHYVEQLSDESPIVVFNDQISLEKAENFDTIILSPGPGLPANAGQMPTIIRQLVFRKKILGVCLGHQALGEYFGATLENKGVVHHGVASSIQQTHDCPLWKDLPSSFMAGRYHSWTISRNDIPSDLLVTATDASGEIMAIQHRSLPVFGVQFHPESIMTPDGLQIIQNFLSI
jgi:anthranilate synthase component 2